MSRAFTRKRANQELALGNFRAILLNATGSITNTTDAAVILNQEVIQTSSGYASQAYSYTPDTGNFNESTGFLVLPAVIATFSEDVSGTGYDYTHCLLWQGRGATSQKAISSINTSTNRITSTGHGLSNGDYAFVRSTSTLPGGLSIQRYYAKSIDANTVELYSDEGLSSIVDITSSGSGTLYLSHANGEMVDIATTLTGTIDAGQSKSFSVSYEFAGS